MAALCKLSYASGQNQEPARWRRSARRIIRFIPPTLLVGSSLLIITIQIRWPWLWYGSPDAYQWHRLLNFSMPAEKIVYEEDPARAAALLALPAEAQGAYVGDPKAGNFVVSNDYVGRAKYPFAKYCPPVLRALIAYDRPALVFAHGRSISADEPSLILVTADWENTNGYPPRSRVSVSAKRCTRDQCKTGQRSLNHYPRWHQINIPLTRKQVLRIYAGQADPNDLGHFTIKYEIDGVPGTIDGRLEADDTVTLKILAGPAATRPTVGEFKS